MISLVGYTGFVGSNIHFAAGSEITGLYNSKNVGEAFGTKPDMLIYAGLRAEKYLANTDPQKDMGLIETAKSNIEKISPQKLILISTVDVLKNPVGATEKSTIETEGLHAYGYNRYVLEKWVRDRYPDALIIRLPGLFGKNIKKNFIYDYINVIPFMLKENKMDELSQKDSDIGKYYRLQDNGFYKLADIGIDDRRILKDKFRKVGFSALNFTDSRSVYQFYNLGRLWKDICTAVENGITLWHPATRPVSAAEVYEYLTGEVFVNELGGTPAYYDYRTIYDTVFGGTDGYICDRESVLEDIKRFVSENAE